ncbi:hypothetical protein JGF37_19300 [Salmonella enterica subsp. enterica serovar Goldcoast]|nr:hypothetical protein [Salmonella enterica subsp. enterica serovar Goldcoast]
MKEQNEVLSSHADYAISSRLAERIARVCGAVWVHNLTLSGNASSVVRSCRFAGVGMLWRANQPELMTFQTV